VTLALAKPIAMGLLPQPLVDAKRLRAPGAPTARELPAPLPPATVPAHSLRLHRRPRWHEPAPALWTSLRSCSACHRCKQARLGARLRRL